MASQLPMQLFLLYHSGDNVKDKLCQFEACKVSESHSANNIRQQNSLTNFEEGTRPIVYGYINRAVNNS